MATIKKLLNPKILVPVFVGVVLLGSVLYILLAPSSWWKPFYVRVDMGDTPTPEVQQTESPQDGTAMAGVPQPGTPPQSTAMAQQQATGQQPGMYVQPGQALQGIMYSLDTKVVNLAEPGGLRYLQTTIVLEFWPSIPNYSSLQGEERTTAEDQFRSKIDEVRPKIDDAVMTVLSSKTYDEIASIEGKQALKQELMDAINNLFGYEALMNVYFTEFLVQ